MNKKMGRPKLPKGKAKRVLFAIKLSPDLDKEVQKGIVKSGQDKAEWGREAVKQKAKERPIWVTCKWSKEQLNEKLIDYVLTWPKERREGVGTLVVRRNNKGELSIEIFRKPTFLNGYPIEQTRYILFQKDADKIEEHPNQRVAHFRLLA